MNVLEKILEEMENETKLAHEEMRRCARGNPLQFDEVKGYARAMEYVVDTIRSHMGEVGKEKVTSAEIISRKIDGKTYYEIKYKKVGKDEYNIGYSSFKLDYVIKWLNDYFEFCGEAKVSCENNGWIPVDERLPENLEKVLVWYEYFRYGEYNCMFKTFGIGWQLDGHWSGDVSGTKARCIAWQPLPEPYKEEKIDGQFK